MRPAALAICVAISLAGCASEGITIRRVPSEDPVAENAAAVESAAAFSAAADGVQSGQDIREAGPPVTAADAPSMYTYDPWERINRFTYRFNARFDEAVFLPVANAYRGLPSPIRSSVHNFFGNLSEVGNMINYALQWRLKSGVRSAGRFVINTTVGIGGLFDVAEKLKLPVAATGLSATLARWGMHPGPYLVIPFLGPSTVRDGIGFLGDYAASYEIDIAHLYRGNVSSALGGVNAVDQRANVNFRYYATGSPFEYENVRFLYVRKRLIEDEGLRPKNSKTDPKSTMQPKNAVGEPAGK